MTELAGYLPSIDVVDPPSDAPRPQEHPAPAVAAPGELEAVPAARPGDAATSGPIEVPGDADEDSPAITALAALVATTHLRRERWELALKADLRNDPAACLEDCLAVLAEEPHHRAARLLGARSARELRDWPEATRLLGELIAEHVAGDSAEVDVDPSTLWDYLTAATVAGDDDAVATGVARLGLDAQAWAGEDAVVFVILDGRSHVARRTGAVRAEICSIAASDRPQHVGDVVAFDPRPSVNHVAATAAGRHHDEPGEPGEHSGHSDAPRWPTFRAVAILSPGSRQVWTARGADPGFAAWEDAVAVVADRGWVLRRAVAAEHGPDVLGMVALPAAVDPAEVQRVLTQATAGWPSPVAWHG